MRVWRVRVQDAGWREQIEPQDAQHPGGVSTSDLWPIPVRYIQKDLAHKKLPLPRTLHKTYV